MRNSRRRRRLSTKSGGTGPSISIPRNLLHLSSTQNLPHPLLSHHPTPPPNKPPPLPYPQVSSYTLPPDRPHPNPTPPHPPSHTPTSTDATSSLPSSPTTQSSHPSPPPPIPFTHLPTQMLLSTSIDIHLIRILYDGEPPPNTTSAAPLQTRRTSADSAHRYPRRAATNSPIRVACVKPSARNTVSTLSTARRAGEKQAARGLRIGEQRAHHRAPRRRHLVAEARPVARRRAGGTRPRGRAPARPDGAAGARSTMRTGVRAAAHLEQVPKQAKAGDVGQGVHGVAARQRDAGPVELRRARRSCGVAGGVELIFLERRAEDAHAQRLAEDQRVARPAPALRCKRCGWTRPIATRP